MQFQVCSQFVSQPAGLAVEDQAGGIATQSPSHAHDLFYTQTAAIEFDELFFMVHHWHGSCSFLRWAWFAEEWRPLPIFFSA